MKLNIFGIHILSAAALAHLKAAGHEVVEATGTPVQHAVAALLNNDIGKTVAADIAAVTDHDLSGLEKFEHVVANTLPALTGLLASGGFKRTVDEVESIGRELVQTVFDQVGSTSAGTIAGELLHLILEK